MKTLNEFLLEREIKASKFDTKYQDEIFSLIYEAKEKQLFEFLNNNQNISLNFVNKDGNSPISLVGSWCNKKLINIMLTMDANINDIYYEKEGKFCNILFLISKDNMANRDYLQYILDKGCDIDFVDQDGDSALMYYLKSGDKSEEFLEIFLDNYIDVEIKNKRGNTAFNYTNKNTSYFIKRLKR